MAFTAKFTAKRGQIQLKDVAVTAGSAEAQSDTISLNMDITNARKGEVLTMIDNLRAKVHASKFPPA